MTTSLQNTDSTYFELKVLIADCVTLESHNKKSVEGSKREKQTAFSELLLYSLSEPRGKKFGRMSQQWTEKSISELSFKIGFDVMKTMILQNTNSRSNLFRIELLIAESVTFECHEKKCSNFAERERVKKIHCCILNWLRHYHNNDSAKYQFKFLLFTNGKFW